MKEEFSLFFCCCLNHELSSTTKYETWHKVDFKLSQKQNRNWAFRPFKAKFCWALLLFGTVMKRLFFFPSKQLNDLRTVAFSRILIMGNKFGVLEVQ